MSAREPTAEITGAPAPGIALAQADELGGRTETPYGACEEGFRKLLPEEAWTSLPPSIRSRFSGSVMEGSSTVYLGEVRTVWMSRAGWWLALLARAIGTPLPLACERGTPSAVIVLQDGRARGQVWTRVYVHGRGRPQVVRSINRFSGPTGLEEHLGRGVVIALTLEARNGSLVFRSAGYFLQILGVRIPLRSLFAPGVLTVTHSEAGGRAFAFTLDLAHRRLGPLVRQTVIFREFEP